MKILIADDDPVIRKQLAMYLKDVGKSDFATDGSEAIVKANNGMVAGKTYDLICLDIRMPAMDGQAALEVIRKLEKKHNVPPERYSKIIMITSVDNAQSVLTAFNNACESYITKPFRKREVLEQLKQIGLIKDEHESAGS